MAETRVEMVKLEVNQEDENFEPDQTEPKVVRDDQILKIEPDDDWDQVRIC